MSISKEEFNKMTAMGVNNKSVKEFLEKNSDKAFTAEEISEEVKIPVKSVKGALKSLTGTIVKKSKYYIYDPVKPEEPLKEIGLVNTICDGCGKHFETTSYLKGNVRYEHTHCEECSKGNFNSLIIRKHEDVDIQKGVE